MKSRWAFTGFVLIVTLTGTLRAQVQKQKSEESMDNGQAEYVKGQSLHRQLKFDSAILYYRRFRERWTSSGSSQGKTKLKEVEKRLLECESGKKFLTAPREFIIKNLGPTVNSKYEDYAPVMNEEGNLLVFTSRRPNGNLNPQKSGEGKYFEDIYFSKNENTNWSLAQNIGPPVNTLYHDSDLALSADGKQLFLYTDENEGDILFSRWVHGKWSVPQRLPWPVNTSFHESSVSVTADGKRLFVASERPGGFGGSDIYVFEKKSTGQWGPSLNLGPSINTAWDEDSPFIDYDGRTLYFSSTGHDSMGGHDIFRSQGNLVQWTPAENLGYPINTPGHDSYFASARDGKSAYYSSVRTGGFGEEDIYHITLPKEFVRKEVIPVAEDKFVQRKEEVIVNAVSVYFVYGSSVLSNTEYEKLDVIVTGIKDHVSYRIKIDGHTDDTGMEKINQDLSLARAQAVRSYFESNGIRSEKIETAAWGASRPVAANDVEKGGRALNRRVEVRVIHD